ncbi:uncharacterized protein PHALS_13366 [Plasmopara halstedii]|uniref:Tubby C-terminal-like domain n=1 Tax=Plasmopara halstedii TaxID=4781 RepID=A0A0P1APL9_PLAHL|nr:uncharacterized protein PHALS_13366 [Plasmopara halstedii]CEG43152.1 hypothetical protein PHALS_13366 [Plasmopara halstedii]|eukprot:XP_024579521.1 hypothetical protein PHALS_13366 [Plasmopara halstedii]
MIRRYTENNKSSSSKVASFSEHFVPCSAAVPLPVTPPAVKRRQLQAQHLGLAAVDAGYCCHELTQLHLGVEWRMGQLVVEGARENSTGLLLFELVEKPLSLHRQRMLLDTTKVPVATIRMSTFRRRKVTYSLYSRIELSKRLIKFTISRNKLEMIFTDIMTGKTCRLGSSGDQGDIEIWLQRGLSAEIVKQPIAHMYLAPSGTPLGYSIDIAEGVDAVMALLVCIALHDCEPIYRWRATSFA